MAAHGAGFQITDTAAHHAFQRFDGAGALTATGRPLTDAGGGVLGNRFFVTDAHGAGGRIEVTDARFTVAAHGGGGFQVTDTAAHHAFQRFDNAGTLTATGRPLTDAGGGVLGNRFFVTDAHGAGGRIEVTDARFAVAAHGGGTQITDTAAGNAFQRFDGAGAHIETGTPGRNLAGQPDRVVVNPAAGGAGHVESLTGVRLHGWQVAPDGAGYRITDQLGLHTGEFRRYDAAGNLLEQSFNVLRDAAPTTRQFVVDAAGRTWRLHDNGLPLPATGAFHTGTLDAAAAGTGRVRLLNRAGVEVFDRRPIPGGTTLDVFRRIDGDFGRTSQRPQWVQLTADGRVVDHGVRRFDTNAVGWRDVNHNGRLVHEIRQGIGGGDVVGLRGAFGDWTWHRFDNAGNRLGHGPRTLDRDGGWTDRLPPAGGNQGAVVQRQWGTARARQRRHVSAVRPRRRRRAPGHLAGAVPARQGRRQAGVVAHRRPPRDPPLVGAASAAVGPQVPRRRRRGRVPRQPAPAHRHPFPALRVAPPRPARQRAGAGLPVRRHERQHLRLHQHRPVRAFQRETRPRQHPQGRPRRRRPAAGRGP
ncbi:hypothetical protein GCM10027610_006030 [Dactylosporangium cerinum]